MPSSARKKKTIYGELGSYCPLDGYMLLCAWETCDDQARSHHFLLFFCTDTASTEIYTLSLHDALPISQATDRLSSLSSTERRRLLEASRAAERDRTSTRLNSRHERISYAVFCLKK